MQAIWKTKAVRNWKRRLTLATVHFDQCQLGQRVAKSTVIATGLPLRHWDGLACDHGVHRKPTGVTSGDLSRYPPQMMHAFPQQRHAPHRRAELTASNPLWRKLPLPRVTARQLHQLHGYRLFLILRCWSASVSRYVRLGTVGENLVPAGSRLRHSGNLQQNS